MFRKLLMATAAPLALTACAGGLGGFGGAPAVEAGAAAPISQSERQQGQQLDPQITAEFGGPYSGAQAGYAAQVGQRIAVESGLSASPEAFDVTLLNSPVNNAFAIPGGYVYVTRQLMALMNNEAELAAVLGHEVGHVAARHSQQRQSVAQRNAIIGVLGQVLAGAVAGDSQIGQILGQGIGTGAHLATLGYSRSQETQSDDLAIAYLVDAGYDPNALATMLASLAAQNQLDQIIRTGEARSIPEWSSTHPDPASRIQRAQSMAAQTGATGITNRDGYLSAIDGMLYGDDPAQGVIDGRDFLYPSARFAFTIPQGFTMQNGTQAVSISGPNAKAQFSTGQYSGNLDSYVGSVIRALGGQGQTAPQTTIRKTRVNGIDTAYTQFTATSNQSRVDVTVFAYALSGNQAFHFVTLSPAGQGLGAMEPMVQSFRRMTANEAAAVKPRYVRVVTVRSGDTVNGLAQRMAFDDYKVERFTVLNGLSQNATLRAGQKVKIVTY